MINGAHVIIYTKNAEETRAFFRDILKFPNVDAGHGWLIFRFAARGAWDSSNREEVRRGPRTLPHV